MRPVEHRRRGSRPSNCICRCDRGWRRGSDRIESWHHGHLICWLLRHDDDDDREGAIVGANVSLVGGAPETSVTLRPSENASAHALYKIAALARPCEPITLLHMTMYTHEIDRGMGARAFRWPGRVVLYAECWIASRLRHRCPWSFQDAPDHRAEQGQLESQRCRSQSLSECSTCQNASRPDALTRGD